MQVDKWNSQQIEFLLRAASVGNIHIQGDKYKNAIIELTYENTIKRTW